MSDSHFDFLANALKLRAYRHQLLASNIANADTPNYKAVDIDFKKALENASNNKPRTLGLNTTSEAHLVGKPVNPLEQQLLYRRNVQSSVDGNTVEADVETAKATDNAVHFNAAMTFLNDEIRGLRNVLQNQ